MRELFNETIKNIVDNSNDRSEYFTSERYNQIVSEVEEALRLKYNRMPLSSKHYRRLKRYDVITVGGQEKLIQKTDKRSTENYRYYCKTEDLFDIIDAAHKATGHKSTRVMEAEISKKFCNVSRTAIEIYLSLCEQCLKKRKIRKKTLAVAPILSNYLNSRCQVDIIDMQDQPDRDYQFILLYQDYLTKFKILRPLKTNQPDEVAFILADLFSIFGAPFILHSDNGREFSNLVIENLTKLWPGLKLVHGKPKPSPSQEGTNHDNIKEMLTAWMLEFKTKQWSTGLKFVQSKRNRSVNEKIKKSPHEAMFGNKQRNGLADSPLKKEIYEFLQTEEDLEKVLEEIILGPDHENDEPQSSTGACAVCETYGILQACAKCNVKVHLKCGFASDDRVICSRCNQNPTCDPEKVKVEIKVEKQEEEEEEEEQKEEKVAEPEKEIPTPVDVGQNVVITSSNDDNDNIIAVVLNINKCGLYELGTKDGVLERFYDPTEFTLADENLIDPSDVPSSSTNSSGTDPVKVEAMDTELIQFVKCKCKRYCNNRRCNCRSRGVPCTSKCHVNSACKNK